MKFGCLGINFQATFRMEEKKFLDDDEKNL